MSESSSSTDTTTILWGEINVKAYPHYENLWEPIHKYQNIKHERNFSCQNDSPCNSFAPDEKKKQLYSDPVGQHIIQLRESCYELNELFCNAQIEKEKQKNSGHRNKAKYKIELPPFSIPEFPGDSFVVSCKNNPKKITSRCLLGENEIKGQIEHFIKQLLAETGYYVEDFQNDTSAIKCLSDITDEFLIGFIGLLKFHKNSLPFSKSDDLWGPLETTLREIKFGGIYGLYKFSCEKFEKHTVLLKKCEDKLARYEKLRNQISKGSF